MSLVSQGQTQSQVDSEEKASVATKATVKGMALECKETSESPLQMMEDKTVGPDFGAVLQGQGPMVKAVLLKSDGQATEIDYDTTPKTMHAYKLLRATPTIVGQYHALEVIVVSGRITDASVALNKHDLRWPFNEHQIRGDLLLYRIDAKCNNVDFTLQEYNDFLSKRSEDGKLKADWERECQKDPSLSEKIDFENVFKDMVANVMSDEMGSALATANDADKGDAGQEEDAEEDESDEILICSNDETNDEMIGIEKVSQIIREKMKQQFIAKQKREPTDAELDVLTESAMNELLEWNKQFEQNGGDDANGAAQEEKEEMSVETDMGAIGQVLGEAQMALDPKERAKIVAMAKAMYESELGSSVPPDELMGAFAALDISGKSAANGAEPAKEVPLSEDELRKQVTNTFDHICKMDTKTESSLVDSICETFKEWKGVEPNAHKVSTIVQTIKQTFGTGVSSTPQFDNIAMPNKLTKCQEEMALNLGINTLYNRQTGSTSDELREYARTVVKQDLQAMAKKKFVETAGRDPSKEEFVEILVQLATETFGSVDKVPGSEVSAEVIQSTGTPFTGPILTTPVRNGARYSRVDFYSKRQSSNEKLVTRSVKKFAKVHGRQPNDEEMKHIKSFVSIEKGTLLEKQFGSDSENDGNDENDQNVGNASEKKNEESETLSKEKSAGFFSFGTGFGATATANGKNEEKTNSAFAAAAWGDDDESDSDYVPPSHESEDHTDDDIEDFIDKSAEERPLV